jgi:4'-phosphopantetheinyl transferase
MIRVYYTHAVAENISPAALEAWTVKAAGELPPEKREQILRLKPPRSRFNSALGWQLLKSGFRLSGCADFELSRLLFIGRKKPRWEGNSDFNLSHSEALLACALTNTGRVGIDVEFIRPLKDRERLLEQILSPGDALSPDMNDDLFFRYWTVKEAVIKAEGSGGVWDMPEVGLRGTQACYKNTLWLLRPLELVPGYAACLACDREQEIRVEAVALEQLINKQG